jgi:predicted PurR-regulated permease PerM
MITEIWVITILLGLVTALFGTLVAMLGWMGNKVYSKLSELAQTMHSIENDLHGKISTLDRRVTRVEAHVFTSKNNSD